MRNRLIIDSRQRKKLKQRSNVERFKIKQVFRRRIIRFQVLVLMSRLRMIIRKRIKSSWYFITVIVWLFDLQVIQRLRTKEKELPNSHVILLLSQKNNLTNKRLKTKLILKNRLNISPSNRKPVTKEKYSKIFQK